MPKKPTRTPNDKIRVRAKDRAQRLWRTRRTKAKGAQRGEKFKKKVMRRDTDGK